MEHQESNRRRKMRFTLHRPIRFKLIENDMVIGTGTGVTIDIGSRGVAFLALRPLKADAFIELSISWPVKLDDQCPVRLVTYGRVLHSAGVRVACSVDQYEFRTQARVARPAEALVRIDAAFYRFVDANRRTTVKTTAAWRPRKRTISSARAKATTPVSMWLGTGALSAISGAELLIGPPGRGANDFREG